MKESAYAAVLGWKNALNVDPRQEAKDAEAEEDKDQDKKPGAPQAIPEREQKMLAAFDIYINYIKDPKDDELVGMKFLKANMYRRYNHFDEAIPIFLDILDHHREHETAEYSANLLLDTYRRLGKFDEMLALVDKLDANTKFLDGKDDLKATLEQAQGAVDAQEGRVQLEKKAKETKDFGKYVAVRSGLPRHLQPQPGRRGQRRGALQRRRLLRGRQVDRRRDPDVQPAREVLPESQDHGEARSPASARRTATSRSTTARRTSSSSTRRSTRARRTRTTR